MRLDAISGLDLNERRSVYQKLSHLQCNFSIRLHMYDNISIPFFYHGMHLFRGCIYFVDAFFSSTGIYMVYHTIYIC